MTDKVKVRVRIKTNKVGSACVDEVEFDREEWESMSEEQRNEACQDIAFNYMEWNWEEVEND